VRLGSLRIGLLTGLAFVLWAWPAATGAQPAVIPLTPPLPDLAPLLEFVEAPLDKPTVPIPNVNLPGPPENLPVLPPAKVTSLPDKATAPVPTSRMLACAGTWLGVASESYECAIARYREGKYDEAARDFGQAVRLGGDRADLIRQARYWLGESYWRLGRVELADRAFVQVAQSTGRDGLELWALQGSGWTALRLGDAARAREALTRLVAARPASPLDAYGRFGLALSLYELGRYEEAQKAWSEATARALPPPLARDAAFWYGETLGQTGQYDRATAELGRFVAGGPHPLLETGKLRLGWWFLAGGKYAASVAQLREVQGLGREPGTGEERDWRGAGLALALLGAGDVDGARSAARELSQRKSKLATPVHLRLLDALVVGRRGADAEAVAQEMLAGDLDPATRAWVLLRKGEASRLTGNIDEARTQYELARTTAGASEIAQYAALRLAQTNFEFREFAQAAKEGAQVALSASAPDLRAAALLLQAEAAYAAGDYAAADTAYGRLLADAPQHPEAPLLHLAQAWTALRRDQRDLARRRFTEFATAYPTDPRRADALVLASELALRAQDTNAGRRLLEQVINQYPTNPRTQFARLNLGILLARSGDTAAAQRELTDWLTKSPFPLLVGRARVSLGVVQLAAGRPAEASREFAAARKEGVGALAALGLGTAALRESRWNDAERELKEAAETGTAAVTTTAEYGLAVAAFQRGNPGEFRKIATQTLDAAPSGAAAPSLLYILTALAVQERDWPGALTSAKRLVAQYKDAEFADDALERIVAGSAQARAWGTVSEAYQILRQQYPRSPFVVSSRALFAEAELESGRPDVARRELEPIAASLVSANASHALVVLGRAREATGDRAGALDAFARAGQSAGPAGLGGDAAIQQARLLLEEKRWNEARGILQPLLKSPETGPVAEAAQGIAQSFHGEGNYQAAAEFFMTAAYVAPESPAGRRALLGAGQSFAALKQPESAAIVYRKLLAQPDLPADLASAARQGLAATGRQ
jgi:tetratricopeptide (TPR) repeat protein